MNVCVIGGAGYVGLITGLGLAELGHDVTNVDVDQERIHRLQSGQCPFYEKGTAPLLRSNLDAGRIRFTTDLSVAVPSREIIFIAVGTPSLANGHPDLSQIVQVAEELVHHMDGYKLVVIKSTVPAGTVEVVRSILGRKKEEGKDFDIAVNPEFLQEGNGLHDFFYPYRIVIGTGSPKARILVRTLYQDILSGTVIWPDQGPNSKAPLPVPLVETDLASAQMIKYASNAFLAARISFINEIAGLCDKVGADIKDVAHGIGYDPRIGHSYMQPGLGFGGPCLEKDLHALINIAEGNGHEPKLLRAVLERNERQVGEILAKLKHLCGPLLYKKTVAVFGLAFKAGTNDVRNSLALNVIDLLIKAGVVIRAYDPVAIPEAKTVRPNISYCEDPYQVVGRADALMVLTEWPCFSQLDYGRIKANMAFPRIVDGRNLLDPASVRALGFTYVGVGRP